MEGLRDEYPKASGIGVAAGIGALWGVAGYTVLWNGVPFGVDRAFVESVFGTLILLPVRTVLWFVHLAEDAAGHPFGFADDNWWIGLAAAAVGAAMLVILFVVARAALRAVRHPT